MLQAPRVGAPGVFVPQHCGVVLRCEGVGARIEDHRKWCSVELDRSIGEGGLIDGSRCRGLCHCGKCEYEPGAESQQFDGHSASLLIKLGVGIYFAPCANWPASQEASPGGLSVSWTTSVGEAFHDACRAILFRPSTKLSSSTGRALSAATMPATSATSRIPGTITSCSTWQKR